MFLFSPFEGNSVAGLFSMKQVKDFRKFLTNKNNTTFKGRMQIYDL